MDVLSFPGFDRIYQETVREVYSHWSRAMQERLADVLGPLRAAVLGSGRIPGGNPIGLPVDG